MLLVPGAFPAPNLTTGLAVLAPSLRFLPQNLRFLCLLPMAMLATSITAASRY